MTVFGPTPLLSASATRSLCDLLDADTPPPRTYLFVLLLQKLSFLSFVWVVISYIFQNPLLPWVFCLSCNSSDQTAAERRNSTSLPPTPCWFCFVFFILCCDCKFKIHTSVCLAKVGAEMCENCWVAPTPVCSLPPACLPACLHCSQFNNRRLSRQTFSLLWASLPLLWCSALPLTPSNCCSRT